IGATPRALTLRHALRRHGDLVRPSVRLIQLLADSAADGAQAAALRRAVEEDHGCHVVDLLLRYPSARPSPRLFAASLGGLQPRLYSISSSSRTQKDRVHLTVAVVRYELHGTPR